MPAWLVAALIAARALAFGTPTRAAITGIGAGSLLPDIGIPFIGGEDPEKKKRRRRRRALTASDRADIAFIAGLLGPSAGKNFALTIATRAR